MSAAIITLEGYTFYLPQWVYIGQANNRGDIPILYTAADDRIYRTTTQEWDSDKTNYGTYH